jgi:hypothetical protein
MTEVKTYPFENCIQFLEENGRKMINPDFKVYAADYEIIFKLLAYFLKDNASAEKHGISFRKGILLTGPVGCGKTSLMSLFRFYLQDPHRYKLKSCRTLSFEFNQEGYSVIQKYSSHSFNQEIPKTYCFDDLGTENTLKYYGNDCNIMAEILLSRYDLFVSQNMLTHLTTNLNSSEIEDLYGIRVRSRMREMFNLIAFDKTTQDKRV